MRHAVEHPDDNSHYYLIGGGIASLAAAALLIRDGGIPGKNILIVEGANRPGGSLDGSGSAATGYVIRGGRMFEPHFGCTYDLFSSIPSLDNPAVSVTEEIHRFSRQVVTSSKCRLVQHGRRIEAPLLQLSWRDQLDLMVLTLKTERSCGAARIEDYFSSHFFKTNFWIMWSTMFAFQEWHSLAEMRRYLRRFIHLLPGFNRLEGIMRTVFNQYDSLILPLTAWLREQGVELKINSTVTAVDFEHQPTVSLIRRIHFSNGEGRSTIDVSDSDRVFITLGSMTDQSLLGTREQPLASQTARVDSWGLWKAIARESETFGRPERFCGQEHLTNWMSFTVTLRTPAFFDFMKKFTGNAHGTGGLVTFRDSSWRLSVVLAHQPHFRNQPKETFVFWGYGLYSDRPGDRIRKTMTECSASEILEELAFHLQLESKGADFFRDAICIPCYMPYITSEFMPRQQGDRPLVVPDRAGNFAFLGQYCELSEDTVFTVEYSVRTAQQAVYCLLKLNKKETPLYHGVRNPLVISRALWTLFLNGR
ncbi:MAG: oleate hydratase [Planctomycetota bacterium]